MKRRELKLLKGALAGHNIFKCLEHSELHHSNWDLQHHWLVTARHMILNTRVFEIKTFEVA
jgi:hypothetical protein